jgi:acetolactate synthase-1/2/3 large subunit
MVDIDEAELSKRTLSVDLPILGDVREFMRTLLRRDIATPDFSPWLHWCRRIQQAYPLITKEYLEDDAVDPHVFVDVLSEVCPNSAVIVPGSSGTGFSVANKQFRIKEGQRFFSSKGHAAMGYGLPSSLGACFASEGRLTVSIVGDGGLMLNIQELQTVGHHRLPIKIFVFNNQGYFSIRTTQRTYFGGHYVGSDSFSGVSLPQLKDLAKAFSLPYEKVETHQGLAEKLAGILVAPGPALIEVLLTADKPLLPKLSSRRKEDGTMESLPLDDMEPFLPREEIEKLRSSARAL